MHESLSKLYALVALDLLDSALLKFSLLDLADELEQRMMTVEDDVKNQTLRSESVCKSLCQLCFCHVCELHFAQECLIGIVIHSGCSQPVTHGYLIAQIAR